MNEHERFIRVAGEAASASLYKNWGWFFDETYELLVVSVFGDPFLMKDGRVYWLNTGTADFEVAADSVEEFNTLLAGDQGAIWLLSDVAEKLEAGGLIPSSAECYSYIKLPILGGEYEVANFYPLPLDEHFAITGDILSQIKFLPDGQAVNIKVVE